MRSQRYSWPRPTSWWSCHTLNLTMTPLLKRTVNVDDDEPTVLPKGVVPACTDKCARWTLTNFAAWMIEKWKAPWRPTDQAMVNTHRNAKSRMNFYPLKTLHQLVRGLLQTSIKTTAVIMLLLHACILHLIVYTSTVVSLIIRNIQLFEHPLFQEK